MSYQPVMRYPMSVSNLEPPKTYGMGMIEDPKFHSSKHQMLEAQGDICAPPEFLALDCCR